MGAVRKYRSILIRGRRFRSVGKAAAAFGVSENMIYKAIRTGTLDRVGLTPPVGGHRQMPIVIRGQRFDSARAAARHFGVTAAAIWQALHEGDIDRVGLGRRSVQPVNCRPVTILGRTWPSCAALSRDLGCGPTYVHHALRTGREAILRDRVMALMLRQDAGAWLRRAADAEIIEVHQINKVAGKPARARGAVGACGTKQAA